MRPMGSMVLALVLLVGCGGKPASGPAWPKQADKETDGGESLAPRAKAAAVAAAAADDDDPVADVTPATDKKDAAKPADATDPAKPAATSTQSIEEIILTTEEIIIEIDD